MGLKQVLTDIIVGVIIGLAMVGSFLYLLGLLF